MTFRKSFCGSPWRCKSSGATRGLTQGGKTYLKGAYWSPWRGPLAKT